MFMGRQFASIWRFVRVGSLVLVLLVGACGSGANEAITVRVDYDHDEFATQFIRYFPDNIQVHPGDTVVFRQDWTGEAHTVTFGTRVNEALAITKPLFEEWGDVPEDQIPPEVLAAYFAAECSLPVLYGCEEGPPAPGPTAEEGAGEEPPAEEPPAEEPPAGETGAINQTLAQPCLIEEGPVPQDGEPCPTQELGAFDGTEAYYNSGFIGLETDGENVFELNVSDSIEPGEYNFFCSVHGSFHSGTMQVVPIDQPIPSPSEVNVQTREELNEVVEPFRQVYDMASEGQFVFGGEAFTGNFSGLTDERVEGLLNEFIPETIETGVGEPITWQMFGPHSISFDVPEYFPIYEQLEDGTIRANEEIYLPAGGAPVVEEPDSLEPIVVDGGTWDGSGFWSSGVLFSEAYVKYTLRISTPGTYRYACLIHPPMVGTVTVTG
jgi:plastocyanin